MSKYETSGQPDATLAAAMTPFDPLVAAGYRQTLVWISEQIFARWGEIDSLATSFGIHSVTYTAADDSEEPEQGDYAVVSFPSLVGFYVEIEDGTYGEQQGFRIYRNDGVSN